MLKKTGLLLVFVLFLSVFSACGDGGGKPADDSDTGDAAADTSLLDIEAKGQLVLGCDDQFQPMGFRDENNEVVGFDIDLARAVADHMGVTLIVKPIDWKTKEMELMNGNIDVIWNGYTITSARNEQVEFTKPYLYNEQVLVTRADSAVNTKADLAGMVVGCQSESAAESSITADEEFINSLSELRTYDTYQQALMDLTSSERVAAVGVDRVLIEYVMEQDPGVYKVLEETLAPEYYGIGCPKGAVALRTAIDDALDAMQEDGTMDEICNKWFGENIVLRDRPKLTTEELEELEA